MATNTMLASFDAASSIVAPAVTLSRCSAEWISPGMRVTYPPAKDFRTAFVNASVPWDLSGQGAIAFTVRNPGAVDVLLGVQVKSASDVAAYQTVTVPAGKTMTFAQLLDPVSIDPKQYGLLALPTPYDGVTLYKPNIQSGWDKRHIVAVAFYLRADLVNTSVLEFSQIKVLPDFDVKALLTLICDQYGQNGKATYPGKISDDATLQARAKSEDLAPLSTPDRNVFGGWAAGPQQPASGFFRTTFVNGRRWLVDPSGKLFYSVGIGAVRRTGNGEATWTDREFMFSWIPSGADPIAHYMTSTVGTKSIVDFYSGNLYRKYGAAFPAIWADVAKKRLAAWGCNTIGKASDPAVYASGLPYIENIGTGPVVTIPFASAYNAPPDPWDSGWIPALDAAIKASVQRTNLSNQCIGISVGNEYIWVGQTEATKFDLIRAVFKLDATVSAAKGALVSFLFRTYGASLAALNAAWGTSLSSWSILQGSYVLPSTFSSGQAADCSSMLFLFVLATLQTFRQRLAEQAPQHLCMGTVLNTARICPEILEAVEQTSQVLLGNLYAREVTQGSHPWLWETNLPVIITEFSVGALDRGMLSGGQVQVGSQAERADVLEQYLTSLIRCPNVCGAHWFKFANEALLGQFPSGENGEFGLVDVTDTLYPEVVSRLISIYGGIYGRVAS